MYQINVKFWHKKGNFPISGLSISKNESDVSAQCILNFCYLYKFSVLEGVMSFWKHIYSSKFESNASKKSLICVCRKYFGAVTGGPNTTTPISFGQIFETNLPFKNTQRKEVYCELWFLFQSYIRLMVPSRTKLDSDCSDEQYTKSFHIKQYINTVWKSTEIY